MAIAQTITVVDGKDVSAGRRDMGFRQFCLCGCEREYQKL